MKTYDIWITIRKRNREQKYDTLECKIFYTKQYKNNKDALIEALAKTDRYISEKLGVSITWDKTYNSSAEGATTFGTAENKKYLFDLCCYVDHMDCPKCGGQVNDIEADIYFCLDCDFEIDTILESTDYGLFDRVKLPLPEIDNCNSLMREVRSDV